MFVSNLMGANSTSSVSNTNDFHSFLGWLLTCAAACVIQNQAVEEENPPASNRAGDKVYPMEKYVEVQIFPKVTKSFEDITAAQAILERLVEEGASFNTADYYKARNYLKEAEALFQEAIKNAKKLLGPLPDYTSEDFLKWRIEMLEKNRILAKSQEFDALKSELTEDAFLRKLMSEQDISLLLESHFQSQQEGKRKLTNIKVRIVLDKLQESLSNAKELQKKAFFKQQGEA